MKVAAAVAGIGAVLGVSGCTTYPTEVAYPPQTVVPSVYGYVDAPIYGAPPVLYRPAPFFWGGGYYGYRPYYGHRHYWGGGGGHRHGPSSSGPRGGSIRGRGR